MIIAVSFREDRELPSYGASIGLWKTLEDMERITVSLGGLIGYLNDRSVYFLDIWRKIQKDGKDYIGGLRYVELDEKEYDSFLIAIGVEGRLYR